MPSYHYRATNTAGQPCSGRLEAENERDARGRLRAQGVWVLELSVAAPPTQGRLDAGRLAFLVRQWASLLASGLTVEQSLEALLGQSDQARERHVLLDVLAGVRCGESLALALARHPRSFDAGFCALVAAGEAAGKLPLLMERMAGHLEARRALQQKLGLALLYPMIVAGVALVVILALMTYVVPQVVEVFAGSRQALPLPTRILISVSDGLRLVWPYLLATLLLATVAGSWLLRLRSARERLHPLMLRLPLLGRLLRHADAGRVAATLGVLTEAGVPLLTALDIAADTAHWAPLRLAVRRGALAVREGLPLSRALAAESLFPPLLGRMAAVGESSGRLGALLSQAGQQLDHETSHRSAWLAGLLEPLTILVMGSVVLSIVLAVLMPIIDMNKMLK